MKGITFSATMTPERLAEIRKRADAASPGPWEWILDGSLSEIWDANDCVVADTDGHSPDDDGEFIAHAREDIPALLNEVEGLRIENALLRAQNALLKEVLRGGVMQ